MKITNYLLYEPIFNDDFSRNDLPRIKDGAYVINLDEHIGQGTHWISLVIDRTTAVYFWSWTYSPRNIMQNQRNIRYSQYM